MSKTKYKKALQFHYEALNRYIKNFDSNLPVKQRIVNYLSLYQKSFLMYAQNKKLPEIAVSRETYLLNCFVRDLNKDLQHIFVENAELESFFKDTKINTLDTVKDFLDENTKASSHFNEDEMKTRELVYALHTPEESYLVDAMVCTPNGKDFCRENNHYYIICWDSKSKYEDLSFDDEVKFSGSKAPKQLAVAINSMMYMKAFPECLRSGVPQDMVKTDKDKTANNFTLKTSEVIVEKCERDASGRIVTPHFRSGSFHYLKSDRYKNKKGQTVWWSPSMVRGRAKVLNNTDKKLGRSPDYEHTR